MSWKQTLRAGAPQIASSNWLTLEKQLNSQRILDPTIRSCKRRKIEQPEDKEATPVPASRSRNSLASISHAFHDDNDEIEQQSVTPQHNLKSGENLASLRKMVLGLVEYTDNQRLPGKYLALDCEMVGVGVDGTESSLARVSLVNFYGAVILDEFVRQRERVVDYRTQYSGIRPTDMVNAKPFEVVQKYVADLLKDRILIGQAVHNDLKVLLLSHSHTVTRDTQVLAYRSGLTKNRRIALRNLVKQELDLKIQDGEHSSVTDARATMAVFRLHKKDWEKGFGAKPLPTAKADDIKTTIAMKRKSKSTDSRRSDSLNSAHKTKKSNTQHPGGGRTGISSGLSTIVHRGNRDIARKGGSKTEKEKSQWWKQLPTTGSSGSKSSIHLARS